MADRPVCFEEIERPTIWLIAVPVLLMAVVTVFFTAKKKRK
jgi:hypothetical protein